jgi:hypothetical protein
MAFTNISVAGVLIGLTILGILFYLETVISGTYSYECLFQPPASTALHNLWKRVGSHNLVALHLVTAGGGALLIV